MPKMKTNRTAKKKYRVNGAGRPKAARAGTSHNTGKKSSKRIRHLRHSQMVDESFVRMVSHQMPYMKKAN
ncbi:MAG: 50S ribosomal protein L35 [Deltaproteobacteria bacterium]|nr:50S ribosomal protein L35 [Deltaproteobacteria bacterium]